MVGLADGNFYPYESSLMIPAINEIDWSSLNDAYGAATEVPIWLHQLASTDPESRTEAIDALFGVIWHQGAIYSASIAALPILADYLADERQGHRDSIAALIASIVTGSCWHHGRDLWPEIVRTGQERALREQGTTLEEQIQLEKPIIEAARRFGAQVTTKLVGFLTSSDPEIRQMIANAVTMFPDAAGDNRAALHHALRVETEDWVRDSLAAAVSAVEKGHDT